MGHFLDNDYETEYARVSILKDVLRQNNKDLYQCPLARTQDKTINILVIRLVDYYILHSKGENTHAHEVCQKKKEETVFWFLFYEACGVNGKPYDDG